ncbi:MAG: WD40/YVTN/BNR-like repeat-containing protein [Aggregatilineales bacterium]
MHVANSALRRIALTMALLTLILVAGSRTSVTQAQSVNPTRPPVDHAARDAYWAARHGPITPAQYQQAVQQGHRLPQASQLPAVSVSGARPSSASPLSNVWTSLGPAPINSSLGGGISSGRIAALAIDPTTSGSTTTIYIASADGGVWKSTNNGASWLPLTDNQASLAGGAIAIDPNNHNIIYVGTGEPNQGQDNYLGSGVLKSTDGGTNWTLLGNATFGPTRSSSFSRIVIDPKTGNIFAASTLGLYISTDGGTTWNAATGVPTSTADDLAINSATTPNSTLYVVIRGNGLYRSPDGGVTWSPLTTGLPAGNTWNRSVIAIAPSSPGTIYLAISNGTVITAGFYTTNGGNNWNPMPSLNVDFTGGEPWYAIELAVDPLNANLVYGGGLNVWYTPNAQAATPNWVEISDWANSSSLHADQHNIAFAPGCATSPCTTYFANDGGLYNSSNPASSIFNDLNATPLAISEFTGGDLAVNFNTTKVALGGTQDNGTDLYQGAVAWNENSGGDGGFTQIDQTNTQRMYSEYIYGQVSHSADGGLSFNCTASTSPTGSCNSVNNPGGTLFYAPLVLDRQDANHLAVGTLSAVYETINATTTLSWYKSSQSFANPVSAIGISPQNSAVIYAGLSDGTIYKTTNAHTGAAATYNLLTTPNGATYISSITFDPNDATSNTVVVTTGQTVNTPGGIFLTTNGGTTWTPITGTLPAYPINTSVVYYSGSTRVIVVGTDYGVSFTTNDGGTWQGLNYGLPNVPVVQLALDQQKTTIAAYTHGRGAWVVSIPTIVTGPRIDTIGIFRPSDNTFYMRLHNTTGFADITFPYNPGTHPYPVVGDWTGAGFDTVGVFDQSNGLFNLRNSNTAGGPDEQLVLGNPNDTPLAGRWQASALTAGVGVFRPSNGLIYLKNQLTTGFADYTMVLGIPGDTGLAGDWNGDGVDTPGVYRPSTISFYLSNQVCNCAVFGDYQFAYGVGGDAPVVGDWTGLGHDGVGLFRQNNGYTYLKNALTTGFADITFVYGSPGDFPVAGHWQIAYPPIAHPENPGSVLVPSTSVPVGAAPPSNGLGD